MVKFHLFFIEISLKFHFSTHPDPRNRPSFKSILTDRTLDRILIDGCIPDRMGRELWDKTFLGKVSKFFEFV